MRLSRQYAKLCDIRDFDDPALLDMVRSILPERDPLTHIERKVWEFAMLALFLQDAGRLDESTQALSVGAGDERILYWLANRIGRVVASDVYGRGEFAGKEAAPSMLEDPASHAPFPYREDRLEVVWMDGRSLSFEDNTFDVVFSLSSIEHFGSAGDVARAAAEIARVLRPRGHAVVVTECLVHLHPLDTPPVELAARLLSRGRKMRGARLGQRVALGEAFTPRELVSRIVRPSGLRPLQSLDRTISSSSWDNLITQAPDGQLSSRTGSTYPKILVKVSRSVFTSVCLVMEKPSAGER